MKDVLDVSEGNENVNLQVAATAMGKILIKIRVSSIDHLNIGYYDEVEEADESDE
jgi:hypothetical protein